jgi:hypothetical protein
VDAAAATVGATHDDGVSDVAVAEQPPGADVATSPAVIGFSAFDEERVFPQAASPEVTARTSSATADGDCRRRGEER